VTEPSRILLVRLSSLGDILHALPALRSLRSAFPEARIDWLVEQKMKFLLRAVPGIDEIQAVDTRTWRKRPWSIKAAADFWELVRRLRARKYDLALDFQGLLKTGLLSYLSGAKCRFGFSRQLVRERPAHWFYNRTLDKPHADVNVVRLNLALAQAAGGHEVSLISPLQTTEEDCRTIETLLGKEQLSSYAIINPGGGWATKRWNPARYGQLAARVQGELDLAVAVTTGPDEEHLYQEIRKHCGNCAPRHFPVSFSQLIPLCLKASLFIGGDTGPFHLACALGTPVVGIFGPTSPQRNGPISGNDESVVRVLPCSFCYGRACPTQNECMDISVDEVFEAVARRLARAGGSKEGVKKSIRP